jgi:hypothetical protein
MIPYQTKIKKIRGTNYSEVKKQALVFFSYLEKRTKRRPYIRSAYFDKQKVFFDYFWTHLLEKSHKERVRRLKYFTAALEVVRKSRNHPYLEENRHKKGEMLYRFAGLTEEKELFYVQIKENKKSNKKYLMSCFPVN